MKKAIICNNRLILVSINSNNEIEGIDYIQAPIIRVKPKAKLVYYGYPNPIDAKDYIIAIKVDEIEVCVDDSPSSPRSTVNL